MVYLVTVSNSVTMLLLMPLNVVMIILLLFFQKQNLASNVYLFGLGTRPSGPGLKHMRSRSHQDPTGALVIPLLLRRTRWSIKTPAC
jgi:hypothetical protein